MAILEGLREARSKDKKLAIRQLVLLRQLMRNIKYEDFPGFPLREGGYIFEIVKNDRHLVEALRLRFLCYSDPKVAYIDPELFPFGLEFDKFDAASAHITARNIKTGSLVGNIRMIHDTKIGLQVDVNLDVSDYRRSNKICEISRVVVYPQGQEGVCKVLVNKFMKIAKDLGISKILCEGGTKMSSFHKDVLGCVPMDPYREWSLNKRSSWGSMHNHKVYGSIRHLDKEIDKNRARDLNSIKLMH